jgi:hypothetical protein
MNALRIRAMLGRDTWSVPTRWGPNGWTYTTADRDVVVVSAAPVPPDGTTCVHASISHPDRDPTYAELKHLHRAVWGDHGFAFQVFVPKALHVNFHEHALHLWGRLDGQAPMPEQLFHHPDGIV